jgi:hypothetical protein
VGRARGLGVGQTRALGVAQTAAAAAAAAVAAAAAAQLVADTEAGGAAACLGVWALTEYDAALGVLDPTVAAYPSHGPEAALATGSAPDTSRQMGLLPKILRVQDEDGVHYGEH